MRLEPSSLSNYNKKVATTTGLTKIFNIASSRLANIRICNERLSMIFNGGDDACARCCMGKVLRVVDGYMEI